jgi:deoxycytidine triphosphate deaminase
MGFIHRISNHSKAVLSDRTILEYNKRGLLIEGHIGETQIQPNSIDLTLGTTWKKLEPNAKLANTSQDQAVNAMMTLFPTVIKPDIFDREYIDTASPALYSEGTFKDINGRPAYMLEPNEFVLFASKEILNIPNGILSFVQGRSSVARLAIQTEQAGLIDAGFRGTITFEVCNQSNYPILLYAGMRVAQVYFFKAEKAATIYGTEKGSKYHGQIEATGSQIYKDPELRKR